MKKLVTLLTITQLFFLQFSTYAQCDKYNFDRGSYYANEFAYKYINENYDGGNSIIIDVNDCYFNEYSKTISFEIFMSWNGNVNKDNYYEDSGKIEIHSNNRVSYKSISKNKTANEYNSIEDWVETIDNTLFVIDLLDKSLKKSAAQKRESLKKTIQYYPLSESQKQKFDKAELSLDNCPSQSNYAKGQLNCGTYTCQMLHKNMQFVLLGTDYSGDNLIFRINGPAFTQYTEFPDFKDDLCLFEKSSATSKYISGDMFPDYSKYEIYTLKETSNPTLNNYIKKNGFTHCINFQVGYSIRDYEGSWSGIGSWTCDDSQITEVTVNKVNNSQLNVVITIGNSYVGKKYEYNLKTNKLSRTGRTFFESEKLDDGIYISGWLEFDKDDMLRVALNFDNDCDFRVILNKD